MQKWVRGVFNSVSPKYLQSYMNEYTFRYNHRDDESPMYFSFLRRLVLRGAQFSEERPQSTYLLRILVDLLRALSLYELCIQE
jgi:hypothetical protein